MRTGQLVVLAIVGTALVVASSAWLFQRSLMTRRAAQVGRPADPAPAAAEVPFERTVAPGGVPAESVGESGGEPPLAEAGVAAAPTGVPRSWAEQNDAAIQALSEGDHERALELFEACHTAYPDQAVFRANLAEALARAAIREHAANSRCTVCIDRLQRACALAPERADLAGLLERWQRERSVEGEFWRESSLHFELSYDGGRRDLLWGSTRLLDELELAYADLGDLFEFYPVERGRPKFRVVLYERAGFSLLTGLGDWAGGAYDGSAIRIPIGDLSAEEARLKRVFRHELCHAFVREAGGTGVPAWLNEGLAQWLEHESLAQRVEEARNARAAIGEEGCFPLEALGGSIAEWKDEAAIARAYRQALAFVGFLWGEYGARVVVGMVKGCKEGRKVEEEFEKVVGGKLAGVFEGWRG